jgi:putative ABC transport system permease protein
MAGRNIKTAIRGLRSHKLRSTLTLLGIVIGVAALITMVAVGDGIKARIESSIESLGSNLLLVQSNARVSRGASSMSGNAATLTIGDAAAIGEEISTVKFSAPYVTSVVQVVVGNRNWSTTVAGVMPNYLSVRDWEVIDGQPMSPGHITQTSKVAVLGETVRAQLFGDEDAVNQTIRIRNAPFTVIGVLDRKGRNPAGADQDNVIFVPMSTAKIRVIGRQGPRMDGVDGILVKVFSDQAMDSSSREVEALLRQRHRLATNAGNDFTIQDYAALMAVGKEATRQFTLLVSLLASVSLIVGGIGVMNVLLVSVSERTREIGLRLSLGARRSDIWRQFLTEALTLSSLGGLIGILIGAFCAAIITYAVGWETLIRPQTLLLGFFSSAAVGSVFGFFPAWKASRLNPIDALRTE